MRKLNFKFWLLFIVAVILLGWGYNLSQSKLVEKGFYQLESFLKNRNQKPEEDIFKNSVKAEIALVGNLNTGQVMYARNADLHTLPASIGKLIAALVVLDKMNQNDVITINSNMINPDWGKPNFYVGEKVKVKDLLNMGLVMSANDAIIALAQSQGEGRFVGMMDQKIKEIGLNDTGFFDALFFDSNGNFTTALDLFKLSRYIYNNYPKIGEITRMRAFNFTSESGTKHLVVPTNQLLDKIPELWGAKTGVTPEAKECLLIIYEFDKVPYVTIVLKSDDRFKDTEILYQWLKSKVNKN